MTEYLIIIIGVPKDRVKGYYLSENNNNFFTDLVFLTNIQINTLGSWIYATMKKDSSHRLCHN